MMFVMDDPLRRTRMLLKNKKIAALVLCAAALMNLAGCSNTEAEPVAETTPASVSEETTETTAAVETTEQAEPEETIVPLTADENGNFMSGYEEFEITSEDIEDGVWADVISNTLAGENVSPELSWNPVEGADQYVIYMVDTTAYYFIHWKSEGVTETHLDQGWGGSSYVGPYPPPGSTHTYDIYVIAIRNPLDRLRGTLNTSNENFPLFLAQIDTDSDGNTGNIIAYGRISGEFTAP